MREYQVILTVREDTDGADADAHCKVGTIVEVLTEGLEHCLGHILSLRIERIA
jgi:hypothetical protein